jgi:hypothetical protein
VIGDAQHAGTWPRLKACGNPDCRWAFYDRSHSQAGAWCDMATCGNRIKNRKLRQRQQSLDAFRRSPAWRATARTSSAVDPGHGPLLRSG